VRNNEGMKKKDQFINTVDDVERITGIDFFPALPDSIEDKIEAYSNINDWQ
jgi:endonuclease G